MSADIDKRFALIADDHRVLYPYLKNQTATGRYGFALSTPEHGRDRNGGGYYTMDIQEVIRGVVLKGWGVRARPEGLGKGIQGNTYKLGERVITGYWVSPELRHLVDGAAIRPAAALPEEEPDMNGTPNAARTDLLALESLTVEDFRRAFESIWNVLSDGQRWMLIGHASSDQGCLSMTRIAQLGGHTSYQTANAQYGNLAHLVGKAIGVPEQRFWTNVICTGVPQDAQGDLQWRIRPEVVDALDLLGWLEPAIDRQPGIAEAVAELEADPLAQDIGETERRALTNARIGQGGYHRQMLDLWNRRCAVTGCAIEATLIASHAKAWRESSNRERLDPYNGLLLSASIDRLFDAGLIGFDDDGAMLTKEHISTDNLRALGLSNAQRLRFVRDRHGPYLAAHRQKHGLGR